MVETIKIIEDKLQHAHKLLDIHDPSLNLERIISGIGGFFAIMMVYFLGQFFTDATTGAMLVASMGASAVLLFAVPHGPLSQPWSIFGGHICSAIVGVTATLLIPNTLIAAAVAVGVAISVMYYFNCIHPPGGATALTAVVGGEAVHSLGYQFVITPVLLNVIVILTMAVLFNALFAWRRYPHSFHKKVTKPQHNAATGHYDAISHADFVYALSEIRSFVDISEDDLLRIYDLATQQARANRLDLDQISVGNYYSNDDKAYSERWSVRQLIDEIRDENPSKDLVTYKVVTGTDHFEKKTITRHAFAHWAKHQIRLNDGQWKQV